MVSLLILLLDENEYNSDKCTPNSQCVNTEGSYYCECLPGYYESGKLCLGMINNSNFHHCLLIILP